MSFRLVHVAAIVAAAAPAHAGGFGIPEIGVRRTGMGAIIGRPDDGSAIYHNPAGLVLSPGVHLYLSMGVSLLDAQFQLAPWQDSDQFLRTSAGSDGYYAPVKPTRAIGVIPMIAATVEILPDRLFAGAGVYVGNATGAAFADDAVTRYHLIDGYVVAPQAVGSIAYRFNDQISIGLTAGVIDLRVHGERDLYPILQGNNISSLFGTSSRLELDGEGWAPTWTLGAFGHPIPRLTWGATITGRVDATLEGPIHIDYADDSPYPGMSLDGTQTTNQLLPWAFMGGANIDLTPQIELGGELRYWLYRQYHEQHTDIVGIAFIRSLDTEKDYHDSWETSGGVRVHDLASAPGLDLMAGMQYDHSPAPAQTLTLDQPSFSHIGLHSGTRYSFGRYRIGASYIHYWYLMPTVTDSITDPPANFKGRSSNNIITASLEVRL
jgi:long-subunit fatty acid transport protein